MKSILISIQPKWVEKIIRGEKTIEVRKSRPKIEMPFKCYIYCTKNRDNEIYKRYKVDDIKSGKVIGDFVCDKVEDFSKWEYDYSSLLRHIDLYAGTNSDYKFLNNYLKGDKKGYAWHISDLKIYDKPKPIMQFYKPCPIEIKNCPVCEFYSTNTGCCMNNIDRPPQSWCYVEELCKAQN